MSAQAAPSGDDGTGAATATLFSLSSDGAGIATATAPPARRDSKLTAARSATVKLPAGLSVIVATTEDQLAPHVRAWEALAASALLESGQWTAIRTATTGDWATLAVVILAGYVAAYSIWYGLLRRYRVDQVTPFAFLMPLFGVVASALLLGETLALGQLAGGAVIMLGLAIVVLARQRSPARLEQA